MIRSQILPFIEAYISDLAIALNSYNAAYRLSTRQKLWLGFCLSGILLTNSICWARYERMSFGHYMSGALSWMFRKSKINWEVLLYRSTRLILERYGLAVGNLELDDTDRERSKNAKHIFKLGKQKDKKSGGYFNGQSIIFLLLVTPKCSIPVGFEFYQMDEDLREWEQEERRLRKQKVAKRYRRLKPNRRADRPTKLQIGLSLIRDFAAHFEDVRIKSVKADALYGTAEFIEGVRQIYPSTQVISQIRSNQKIVVNGKTYHAQAYFSQRVAVKSSFVVRGGKSQKVYYSSVIAKVQAHKTKRLIIALKYEGEKDFRYLIASDMTWRVQDVLECFSQRWLVEVFIQDWKTYEGWGQMTKHVGEDGARRSLLLSLLFDHCLLSHPLQAARIKDNLPLYTVGSLRDRLSVQALLQLFEYILEQPEPAAYLEYLAKQIQTVYRLRESSKHLSGKSVNWETT